MRMEVVAGLVALAVRAVAAVLGALVALGLGALAWAVAPHLVATVCR